jgi:hypothetical protein
VCPSCERLNISGFASQFARENSQFANLSIYTARQVESRAAYVKIFKLELDAASIEKLRLQAFYVADGLTLRAVLIHIFYLFAWIKRLLSLNKQCDK